MQTSAEFLGPLRVIIESIDGATLGPRGIFSLSFAGITVTGENMSSTLQAGKQATAKVSWVDAAGNPAVVDGDTSWDTTDAAILTVDVDPGDSTSAIVRAVGPIGPAQIQATADADMGSGVQTITAMLDVTVIAGMASGGTISLGEPAGT